jgi:hypothetical protein
MSSTTKTPTAKAILQPLTLDLARVGVLATVCAWCGCLLRAEVTTLNHGGVSHGLCSPCGDAMWDKWQKEPQS